MERVDVYRGAAEMDADGNPVQGEMRHVATLMGFVEPVEASQSPAAVEGAHGVLTQMIGKVVA